MDKMDHNAHSVYLMYYHLIMVVKYRRKVIDDPISERAKEIWERIAPDYGITLEEWNHDVDHVHVMFRAQPKSELSKFINAYKSASSRLLKKEYPQIRERLWKEAFWSQSFCLLTAGGAPIDVIRNYIETQDHFNRCPSCRQKAETLAPECFFPKFFPDFRILFFQQPAAGTFISIDKFTEFRFRLCTKHYMHMVNIMIPFLQNNSISGCNIFPYFFCSF